MMSKNKKADNYLPEWAKKAENDPDRLSWVDVIPRELWELGQTFFPLPFKQKHHTYAHHLQQNRYHAYDETLNAYLRVWNNYGIACANDLAVVDIDEPEFIEEMDELLPHTLNQVTGSREGKHYFFKVKGLTSRQILHYKDIHDCNKKEHSCTIEDGECVRINDWSHLGEIKCDPHGYVVGPNSVHPSGNTYGPLEGDEIISLRKDELLGLLEKYIKPKKHSLKRRKVEIQKKKQDVDEKSKYEFYSLDADDVVPWLEPDNRIEHPGHGSDSNMNFMKNSDCKTFICWRHDYGNGPGCGLNGIQLLAQLETGRDCDEIRRKWPMYDEQNDKIIGDVTLLWYAWKRAVNDGLIRFDEIPYKVAKGYAVANEYIDEQHDLYGDMYYDTINEIRCIVIEQQL